MHIADRCAPRKIVDGAEKIFWQALQFELDSAATPKK
jgi:hypothetical protein